MCNKRDFMLITNKSLKEEDGEEIVTYDRKWTLFLTSKSVSRCHLLGTRLCTVL